MDNKFIEQMWLWRWQPFADLLDFLRNRSAILCQSEQSLLDARRSGWQKRSRQDARVFSVHYRMSITILWRKWKVPGRDRKNYNAGRYWGGFRPEAGGGPVSDVSTLTTLSDWRPL